MNIEQLRYPVGKFSYTQAYTSEERMRLIEEIAALPRHLRAVVDGLDQSALDTPYRPEGWTIRQLVHHVADSHMNGYIRLKLALTEENPTIKPYEEDRWARLEDTFKVPVIVSLDLLDAIHTRWVALWQSLGNSDYARTFIHPVSGLKPLDQHLGDYAWHGRHHLAHITQLRERMGW